MLEVGRWFSCFRNHEGLGHGCGGYTTAAGIRCPATLAESLCMLVFTSRQMGDAKSNSMSGIHDAIKWLSESMYVHLRNL